MQKPPRLQICLCGHLFLSDSQFLQESWVRGGFYPRSISLHRETALLYERNTLIQRNGDNDETHEPTDWLLRAGLRSLRRQNRNDYKRYCPARENCALWSKLNGVPITPDMMSCTGCRVDGPKTPFCDKLCPIHTCVREKGFDTCADCAQMDGCPVLGRIAANNPAALERLKRLCEPEADRG